MDYISCTQREGFFWMVFNCQEEFFYVSECQEREFCVEMDKLRRSPTRNTESWWRQLYSDQGEVGRQKDMQFGDLTLLESVKMTFLGEESVEDKRFYYGRPDWSRGTPQPQ